MHPSQHLAAPQQRRVEHHARHADSRTMFDLLTGPQLLDQVEALLPAHRERLGGASGVRSSLDASSAGGYARPHVQTPAH